MRRRARVALAAPFSLMLALGAAAEADRAHDVWYRAGREAVAQRRAQAPRSASARNVILFVGDGMGLSTVTAARILAGQQAGGLGEEHWLSFERLPYTALSRTYNTNQQVPESAGTMSALITGVKTRAGSLSVDETVASGDFSAALEHSVPTLIEEAEARGLATGVVTNTTITHATPAACYAHSPHRDWEHDGRLSDAARAADFPDLARQLVEFAHGDGIEVAFGGGRAHFLGAKAPDPEDLGTKGARPDERDLTKEWRARHADGAYIWNLAQFKTLDPAKTRRVLGLFDPSHMEFEIDRAKDTAGEPSLSEMTEKAIQILSKNPRGFVLMVEGGKIDHAHHANNARRALTETIELSRAVQRALDLTDPKDTLIVVTADHSQPLAFAGYATRGNPILGKLVVNGLDGEPSKTPYPDALGRPMTTLSYPAGPGNTAESNLQPAGPKKFPHFDPVYQGRDAPRPDLSAVDTTAASYLQEAHAPLRSGMHAGEDVAIYAGGPGAELFSGVREQNYVYHAIVDALGWSRAAENDARAKPQP
ncbi:MAG TPA: alkaline phosphatase [Myxococcota bacterium]|nr:alkaline phosphatase [Myxococcota bacterium]